MRVSILTRPEGRVQLAILPEEWLIQVSILTRPEGRVQPKSRSISGSKL